MVIMQGQPGDDSLMLPLRVAGRKDSRRFRGLYLFLHKITDYNLGLGGDSRDFSNAPELQLTAFRVWCKIRHHLKRGLAPVYLVARSAAVRDSMGLLNFYLIGRSQ